MERKPLVVGNWKMELSHKASVDAAATLKKLIKQETLTCEVVVCPSFPALEAVGAALASTNKIQVGAQHVHWEEKGAWTGEVSVLQIKSFVKWCIVGHSERRQNFGETDEHVIGRINMLLKHSITPIVCIGETLEEHAQSRGVGKVTQQAQFIFSHLTMMNLKQLVIAYEPIWAISTQHNKPDPDGATEIMLLIRKLVVEHFGPEAGERVRIIYGGSVTPETVTAFAVEPGIDGVLVGGASVRPLHLAEIVERVGNVYAG